MIEKIETIAVIGAGIMGLMSAYTLSRDFPDARVTIFDLANFPADNASFIAGGMIAPYSELDHMPQDFLPAGLESIALWKACEQDLGADFEFTQNGSIIIAHDEDRHLLERFKSILPAQGWTTADAKTLEPALPNGKFKNAIHISSEAHLHPRKVMQALCDALPYKEHREITPEAAARDFDLVIDCRGMNAKKDLSELRGVKGEIAIVKNTEFSLSRHLRLMHPRYPLYIVPRADNIFLIGASIIESADNNTVSLRSGMELLSALYSLHPSFGDAQILEIKAGIRPSFPDNLPRISRHKNIIRANGLYRHGYLFSPVMARCICALAREQDYAFNHLFIKPKDIA